MIIFQYFALALLITLVIYQSIVIQRLTKDLRSTKDSLQGAYESFDTLNSRYKELRESRTKLLLEKADRNSVDYKTFGVDEDDYWYKFNVYMQGRHGKYTVKTVWFDKNDPDDRAYKRIHAEEVAEILNEDPNVSTNNKI